MIAYSLFLYRPEFSIVIPENYKEILSYSFYILLAGSAASFLIDIDKYMIPQKEAISQTAYYAVAVFIATVVEIPGRAMFQILNPLVAKSLNEQNFSELKNLYNKSSENLLLVSGLFFLLINLNIDSFYILLNNEYYSNASLVVLIISSAKLIQMSFGCGPAILATSTFYRITLPFSISMAVSVYLLNDYLIDIYGINGAAISTFIVLLIFTVLKVLYIIFKIKIQPYNLNSLKIIFSIFTVYLISYFIKIDFNPLLEIVVRSVGIVIVYLVMIYFLGISQKLKDILNLKFKF
jgi:O-antigen/teichoic acid export membrane protein